MPEAIPVTVRRILSAATLGLVLAAAPAAAGGRADLLFAADFDEGADVTAMGFKFSGNQDVPLVEVGGQRAARILVDRNVSKVPYRTEIVPNRLPASHFSEGMFARIGQEYWYGMRTFLPADWQDDKADDIIVQFHAVADPGESTRNPPVALQIVPDSRGNGRFSLRLRADERKILVGSGESRYRVSKSVDLGPIRDHVGRWTDWVWHVKWNYDGDGFLRLYRNGQLVVDHKGANTFNDEAGGPYLKVGLYKYDWNGGARRTGAESRTLYVDEIRVAGANGGYASVAPGK